MPKQVPGDPLTGSLPRTRLIVPQEVLGPMRTPRPRAVRLEWPIVPDPMAVTVSQMRAGRVAYVRTRWGIRRRQIRTINRSTAPGPHRGRHFFTGMTRRGWCRSAWVDQVIRVETVQQALTAGRVVKAIGAGR